MSIFDKKVEIKTIEGNNMVVKYEKHIYSSGTYFIINCPKYLHEALRSRYGSIYGVDVCDNKHLSMTNENGIVEIFNEIQKGKNIYETYHSGQSVLLNYDSDYNFHIVFVKGMYTDFYSYMVNHTKEEVSPIHGYPGHGREYAKKIGYKYNKYNNLYKK